MRGVFPRDPLLVGRLGAFLGAVAWLWLGGQGIMPLAVVALTFLVATSAGVWWLDRKRGHALRLHEVPAQIVLADLGTAGVWMVGSATNPRSIAFVIVLAVGAFAMYRLGRAGLIATMTTYLAARLGMEALRVALGDPTPVPQPVAAVREIGVRALIVVPIFLHGEFAATITVGRLELRPFDADDRAALESLASHASIALRNARIIEQGRRLETLSRELSGAMPEDVIDRIAQAMQAVFDLEWVIISEVKGDLVRSMAALGKAAPARSHGWISHGPLLRQVVAARQLVLMRDYATDSSVEPDRPISMLARDVGVHATMVAPIILDGEIRAALTVGTTDPYRSFDAIERQELLAFADLAASALRAANERRERERRIGRLSALNVLAWQLAAVHEPFGIAKLAHDAAATLLRRDSFSIARYDERTNELEFVLEARGDDATPGDTRQAVGSGPTSQVVLAGEPFRTPTEVHLPMKSRGKLVGVLACGTDVPNVLDDEDVAVLQTLANLVATAFENAGALARMRELYLASVRALAAAVDARDPYTRTHSARVAALP